MSGSPSRLRIAVVLGLGMVAISSGSVLVRLSQEAPALVIALYRVGLSSLVFAPFYLAGRARRPAGSPRWWQLAAGVGLALHFAFWIASLRHTTVAVSVLLVNTAPALVAPVAGMLFGERLTSRGKIGLGLAFGGSALLVVSDLVSLGNVRGALLALGGALMLAVYLLAGRHLRRRLDLVGYALRTYLLATLVLALLVLFSALPVTGFSDRTWLFLVLLALGPQCLGHTSYNWALAYVPATLVAILILTEPILAPLWAWWILDEVPGGLVAIGGVLVGAGILAVAWRGVESEELRTQNTELRPTTRIPVAIAIPSDGGRVLIRRRPGAGPLGGLWEFPGGKVRPGETPAEAVRRELEEETGLELSAEAVEWLVLPFDYPDRRLRLHFYLCSVPSEGQPAGWQWVDVAQLANYPMPEANREIIERLKSGSGTRPSAET